MADKMFTSSRLLYRGIEDTPEDFDFLHSISLDVEGYANSNTKTMKPQTKEHTKQWKINLDSNLISVIICLPPSVSSTHTNSEPVPVGIISLTGTLPTKYQHRSANISIDILPPYQRRGYGSEAIRWIVEWGFRYHGLHRIAIQSFSHNEGAGRLYESLGFIPEGRLRESLWYNGGWSDELQFAILEHEWKKRMVKGEKKSSE